VAAALLRGVPTVADTNTDMSKFWRKTKSIKYIGNKNAMSAKLLI
jgi:hypothetical protein